MRFGTRPHPPREVIGFDSRPCPGHLLAGNEETQCEWNWRTRLVDASRRTDQRIPSASSSASDMVVLARSGHDASAVATSLDKETAFTETSLRGVPASPVTDTPKCVDRTETSLSSERSPPTSKRHPSDAAVFACSSYNASAATAARDKSPAFTGFPPRGGLVRPPTDTPKCDDLGRDITINQGKPARHKRNTRRVGLALLPGHANYHLGRE